MSFKGDAEKELRRQCWKGALMAIAVSVALVILGVVVKLFCEWWV